MRHETEDPRNSSPQILPLVIAAFAGAVLAVACERPASQATSEENYARYGASPASPSRGEARSRANDAPAKAATPAVAPASPKEAITDTVITTRVKSAILADPAMAGADVSVNTDHGAVNLVGPVKSHEQIAIASAHAQRQDGVLRVDNHLAVNAQ